MLKIILYYFERSSELYKHNIVEKCHVLFVMGSQIVQIQRA